VFIRVAPIEEIAALCEERECPACKAGIPRRVIVGVRDVQTDKIIPWSMSESLWKRINSIAHLEE